jgi:hypothetical protein
MIDISIPVTRPLEKLVNLDWARALSTALAAEK